MSYRRGEIFYIERAGESYGSEQKLYNNSDADYEVKAGDKISQLVILPVVLAEVELTDSLEDTERGDGGFGSTGK